MIDKDHRRRMEDTSLEREKQIKLQLAENLRRRMDELKEIQRILDEKYTNVTGKKDWVKDRYNEIMESPTLDREQQFKLVSDLVDNVRDRYDQGDVLREREQEPKEVEERMCKKEKKRITVAEEILKQISPAERGEILHQAIKELFKENLKEEIRAHIEGLIVEDTEKIADLKVN